MRVGAEDAAELGGRQVVAALRPLEEKRLGEAISSGIGGMSGAMSWL